MISKALSVEAEWIKLSPTFRIAAPICPPDLEDGRCSFSNNLSENAIRPFTVGRKNWLFCDTPNGAQASAIVYTMVEMAKANGVNVYHYLTYLLEKLPDDRMSDDELELLAPWKQTRKTEIEHRANESNQSYVNCQGAPATEK